jgi:spore germination protein KB
MDKTRISGYQFMFCIAFFLQASSLLTSFMTGVTKHDSWVSIVLGAIICIPLVLVYRTLMLTFPNKNFLQMLTTVFGPMVGKILGFGFFWFIFTLLALNLKDMGNFTKTIVLETTPEWVLTLMCVILAAFLVRYGLNTIIRYHVPLTILEFAVVFLTIVFVANQMNIKNFFPMFQLPPMKYVQGVHIVTAIPLGELVVFLMATPCVNMSRKDATKYWLGGMAMGVLTLMLTLLRDISVLGNTMSLFSLPGLMTLRLVDLGETLSRVEVLFSSMLILLLFFKVSVLLYTTTIAAAQLANTTAYKHLALVLGVLSVVYGISLYPNVAIHTFSAQNVVPFIWSIFEVILPLAVLITARLRGFTPATAVTHH